MKTKFQRLSLLSIVLASILITSCFVDDPGPLQEIDRQYAIVDFDRLEMGDAFHIEVEQGNFFAVNIRGDRRNVEDLVVKKEGATLVIRYRQHRERRHDTYIDITMPVLNALNFSGASESRVHGFSGDQDLDVYLSGASICQLDVSASHINASLSGASYLNLRGSGLEMDSDISGASILKAFNFPVLRSYVRLSGASDGQITATEKLEVSASGGSHLVYRGNPTVTSDLSGGSAIHQD